MSYRAGIDGTVTINGQELPITGWRVGASATLVEFKNSKTGKHPRRLSTFTDSNFEIMVDWDDADNIFGSPIAAYPGVQLTNVRLYIDGSAGSLYWSYPSAFVAGTPQDLEVAGKVNTRMACAADGVFGPPGQAPS